MATISRREIATLIKRWRAILGIAPQWRIGVRIHQKPVQDDTDGKHAEITVLPAYYSAELDIYPWNCVETDMDFVICHEMLHIVLKPTEQLVTLAYGKPLEDIAEQHYEALNDFLTDAFVKLHRSRKIEISIAVSRFR